jgi:hypothetical protein
MMFCKEAACLVIVLLSAAQSRAGAAEIRELEFLLGRWEAEGGGTPGASAGTFTFESAAGGRALVRHNESQSPSGRHSDVMLVYREPDGRLRATYADNEGHIIHYTVEVSGREVVFLGEERAGRPRFRLWYRRDDDATLATKFEIALAGSADFKTYLEGTARRK